MFCPECKCEFVGWTGKCPGCQTRLVEASPSVPDITDAPVPYEALVDLVTTEVGRGRKWGFPYLGYGFGWERGMRGDIGGNEVVLTATKVAMEKKWGFPYSGYGFGWTQEMSGECGAQLAIDLSTTDVGRQTRWRFPYLGYGFAWAENSTLALTLKQ